MLMFPFIKNKKTEEKKLGVEMGKEQAIFLRHTDFEVPLINPNGNGYLDMQV